ncbi:uncharacterized protein METZ01_LOCUS414293, partial [marine metagenome]
MARFINVQRVKRRALKTHVGVNANDSRNFSRFIRIVANWCYVF